MKWNLIRSLLLLSAFILPCNSMLAATNTNENQIAPAVVSHIFSKARENNNWKVSSLTAKDAQIVFMSISPKTNPKNEIGMEIHPFDQVIFVAEGKGKAILNDKSHTVSMGDLIFIPQGTKHNVVNLNKEKPLKIISVYSGNDMPAHTTYKKKSDEPHED